MGSAYARRVSKVERPRVGLLNMGSEESKGGDVLVEAYKRLKALPALNFVGNIEGNDVATGKADVIVCEGLLGNVVLKLLEGIGEVASTVATHAAQDSWRWRIGMAMLSTGISRMRDLTDFRTYGGAPILGFEQPLHQGARALDRAGDRQRDQGRREGRARPRLARDRRDPGADPVSVSGTGEQPSAAPPTPAVDRAASVSLGSRQDVPAERVRDPAADGADPVRGGAGQGRTCPVCLS